MFCMKISGLLKLTLLDYPKKTACTVFFGGCNLRCPFCHNSSLVLGDNFPEAVSNDEFFAFLEKRKGLIDGVCITGGEPLLQNDLVDFVKKIKESGYLVKLDTNGFFPDKLKEISPFLDYVAMDIKNSIENYPKTVGFEKINDEKVLESIDFLINGELDFEFRTTAVKNIHTISDFEKISQMISGAKKYFIQNYKNSSEILGEILNSSVKCESFTQQELDAFAEICRKNIEVVEIRN